MGFSKQTIELAGSLILDRVYTLMSSAERLSAMSVRLLLHPENISRENKELISHMLSIIEFYPDLYGLYYGTANGSFIEVVNLSVAGQTHLLSDPTKPLPSASRYGLRILDRGASAPSDIWYYIDAQFNFIGSEPIVGANFDPRTRAWYEGALRTKGLYWTDVYRFSLLKTQGITVSDALLSSANGVSAVAGADLSLRFLSEFLNERVIGKRGQAFILDEAKQVIIPAEESAGRISRASVSAAIATLHTQQRSDVLFEEGGVKYIASLHEFPIVLRKTWSVLIVVPVGDFLAELLATQHQVVLISVGIALLAILLVIYFSKRISVPIVTLAHETDKIKHLDFSSNARVDSNVKEIILMDDSIASMRVALRSFSRYIPKEIVMRLVEKGQELTLGGEKKQVAILFSDITGFTSIAEERPTEELLAHLTDYFLLFSRILLQHEGTIDKYLGDGMMALWGAPTPIESPAKQACLAALECQAALTEFNRASAIAGKPIFHTRFGINIGTAIVGNIGTMERMNYTAMGDAVNVAARLQPINKVYQTSIIISEDVARQLGDAFAMRPLDDLELRGKKQKTKIYELIATKEGATKLQAELCAAFTQGYEAYAKKDNVRARALFVALRQKFPDDYPTQLYLERLK